MWKVIVAVVSIVSIGAAAYLFWDGHQAADDTHDAQTQTTALNAQGAAARAKTAKLQADATALDARGDLFRGATGDMRNRANAIATSVGAVIGNFDDIKATINPIVNQPPSAAVRAKLSQAMTDLANHTTQANNDADALHKTADSLTKATAK